MNVFSIINYVKIFDANYNQSRVSDLWFWCIHTNTTVMGHGYVKNCSRFDFIVLYKYLETVHHHTRYGATQLSLKQD